MLQLKRLYKALSLDVCKLCMKYGESVDHLFLHCPLTLGLWYRLFRLTKMDLTPSKSICDTMTITYKGLGSSRRGLVLRQATCLAWICVMWRKEMLGLFKARQGLQRFFRIPFISLLLFGPLASQLLRAFPLIWFNLISYQCVVPRVCISKERLLFIFTIWFMLSIWYGSIWLVITLYLGLLTTLEVPFV